MTEPSWRDSGSERRFLLASALRPDDVRGGAAELAEQIDLVVTSPTELARQAAARVVGDRWVYTVEEPLLAPRAPDESGADVLARLAETLRGLRAYESNVSLVMCDAIDVLGARIFVLDEKSVVHVADALEQLPVVD